MLTVELQIRRIHETDEVWKLELAAMPRKGEWVVLDDGREVEVMAVMLYAKGRVVVIGRPL